MPNYQVKVDIFEGPFDLLLYLIRKNELDIYNVSLSEITSQYLSYIRNMQQMDLDVAGEFLVIAATLIYIKTQRMLPQPQTPEEIAELEQTEEELKQKLEEYQKYKLLGETLWECAEDRQLLYTRKEPLPQIDNPSEIPVNATLNDLVLAFQKYARFTEAPTVREVELEEYTVEMKIDLINALIKENEHLYFSQLRKDTKNRVELVCTVLAVLEMCRLKHLSVKQPKCFADFLISSWQSIYGKSLNGNGPSQTVSEMVEQLNQSHYTSNSEPIISIPSENQE